MYTYKEYKNNNNNVLLIEEAEQIYEKMISAIDFNNSDLKEIWDELIKNALEYSQIRSKWLILTKEERMDNGKNLLRTRKHDVVISLFNILSRYMNKIGRDVSWREQLGNERKRIGDFICYIAFIYGLNSR